MDNTSAFPLPTYPVSVRMFNGTPAPLLLQAKGDHAGRPLQGPTANCFAVWCDHPHLYAVAFAAYCAEAYRPILRGSVIPFIVVSDVRQVLEHHIQRATPDRFVRLAAIAKADELLRNNQRQRLALMRLRLTLAQGL